MEDILSLLRSAHVDPEVFLKSMAVLAVGSLLLGAIGRFVFGKRSGFSHAVSSAIAILFIYAVTVVVYSAFAELTQFIPPLPYVTIDAEQMTLFRFEGSHYTVICNQVLNMIILAFLANLLDSCIPSGKNPLIWLLLKCVTVLGAIALQLLVNWLLDRYMPADLMTYAPTILLGLLVLLLLVGALKLVVGALLASVHPLIGAFYTFFFATLVGRSLTKAMLTTAILSGLVLALNYLGCTAISIASAALIAYIPLVLVLALVWYAVNRIMH
ncbi:MAG: hypothetical protein J6Q53_07620 [Oscillospiraceae bacterium]|nr:hypothetical protein [Oscillospiraceae bacterium]